MATLIKDDNGIYTSDLKQVLSYPAHGNSCCFGIESNSFWFGYRNKVIREIIRKFPFRNNYADIGGGNGYQAEFIMKSFPEREVFLVEPGYEGCLNAKKYGVKNVYNCTFDAFDFTGNNIGAVSLFDVVEHIKDDVGFLQGIAGCVPKGTLIYITVPAYMALWSDTDEDSGHYRRYNSAMLSALAKKTGLEVLYNGYFMFYLTLPIFLGRTLPYKIKGGRKGEKIMEDEVKQHSAGAVSGMALKILNAIDFGIIHNFDRLFTGASCIAVFRT